MTPGRKNLNLKVTSVLSLLCRLCHFKNRFLAEREAAAASRKALLETQLSFNKRDHDALTRSTQEVITRLVAELHDAAQNQQRRNSQLKKKFSKHFRGQSDRLDFFKIVAKK